MFMDTRKIIAAASFFVILGGGLFYFGYRIGASVPHNIIVEGVSNLKNDEPDIDFSVFWQAWDQLRKNHINGEKPSNRDFMYGAISGLTRALGDPNTVFFSPSDAKKFQEDVRGKFGGVGMEIGIRDGNLVVIAPLKGTPAERAGLRPGDIILSVDGKSMDGVDVFEAVKDIRGDEGTTVVLKIFREGWQSPREISIVRETITIPTIETKFLAQEEPKKDAGPDVPQDIAHVKLFSFNENAPKAFLDAIVDASSRGAKGLILDLRNNPGGFLEVAVQLAGWFIDRGEVVVTQRFKSGEDRVFRSSGNAALKDFPTVILVNGGSASASEILAGAVRHYTDAVLVGEQTFGKGSVQELFTLKDNSQLKITIAQWVLPDGTIIDGKGLTPDVEVKITEDDINAGRDPQLEKAIEILREKI